MILAGIGLICILLGIALPAIEIWQEHSWPSETWGNGVGLVVLGLVFASHSGIWPISILEDFLHQLNDLTGFFLVVIALRIGLVVKALASVQSDLRRLANDPGEIPPTL